MQEQSRSCEAPTSADGHKCLNFAQFHTSPPSSSLWSSVYLMAKINAIYWTNGMVPGILLTEADDERMREGEKTTMPFPPDPIAAVIHPDPYPYYAELVAS